METKNDTIGLETLSKIEKEIDILTRKVEIAAIREEYFDSILSHSWTLLTVQTMIFVLIVTMIIVIVGFISWKVYFLRLNKKVDSAIQMSDTNYEKSEKSIKRSREELEAIINQIKNDILETTSGNLLELKKAVDEANRNAARGLYEQKGNDDVWRVIWHIRYIGKIDIKELEAIRNRLKQLENEYARIKNHVSYNYLVKFPNIGGIREILYKLSELNDKEIKRISLKILDDIGSNQDSGIEDNINID